ncbi:MAG: putative membrane protein [Candidatus Amesbacteria bacterium GW2011_GWA2_47_11b]|uniref:Putative membrane protein n=3 Tax=Candidatus Amesiibacteriota TaxID=1752730 RepID=A0A0G1UV34_9BACT|nr:MAG: putative membrane protein [Microgenomates group bacterium GW2011_GWC1_46_20]KKU58319.1 MAG: putative membrane protein [Candidatus Amesbacteria bacterium GW2011_GWA2_47_11b]KKU69908.1 MAG: putative membrane protein [Candidatus Amesbacteria bacterium GW2011_GWA1_47_20]KKU84813.1 MAG: putative membrane protein [Candidatus Amesbacteria bacterium GW2011_GWC2_47_8]
MNYWLIFLTGLTTGGLTCLAVQGGLLAATLATTAEKKDRLHNAVPTLMFLGSKLLAYTILGALLGYFGSVFQLTTPIRIWFQVITAVLMLGLAGNMLDLHPIFRYFVIQPPKWAGRLLRGQTKNPSVFAPALLGIFTIFIPCGVTQAMEVLAISSGHPLSGAIIMFAFVLGTSPLFLALGWLTTKLSESFRTKFFKFASLLVVFIALTSINGALVLSGSKYSFDHWVWAFKTTFLSTASASAPTNDVTINVFNNGYSPHNFSVKVNQPVNLSLVTQGTYSCASVFTIPFLNITKVLPPTGTTNVTFTPTRTGLISFACGMGMYTGTINVVP